MKPYLSPRTSTVSYTHLDVYKRQALKGMLIGWIESNLTNMFTDVNEKVGTIAAEVGQTPVSYTHLDVYKRQDYTRKGGVICSDILLPSHAPPEYTDRQTLWNAVEKAERGKNAQLAYIRKNTIYNRYGNRKGSTSKL